MVFIDFGLYPASDVHSSPLIVRILFSRILLVVTVERRAIGAPLLFRSPLCERIACVRRIAHAYGCARAKETPKWVNTDNYVFHASAHTSKFHLIPLTANPASFFIPPRARTTLLSRSTMRSIAYKFCQDKKDQKVLTTHRKSFFFRHVYMCIILCIYIFLTECKGLIYNFMTWFITNGMIKDNTALNTYFALLVKWEKFNLFCTQSFADSTNLILASVTFLFRLINHLRHTRER